MIIYDEDTEEVREEKREINEREGRNSYQRRAQSPPTAVYQKQQQSGIEQAKIQQKPYDGIQGDTQFTNGEVRNVYLDGHSKKYHAFGFAGMCRDAFLAMHKEEEQAGVLGTNDLLVTRQLRKDKKSKAWKEPRGHGGVRKGAGRKPN